MNPIVLIGGFGSHWTDYNVMGKHLARTSGRRVFIAGINRLSWVVGGITDYFLLIERTHRAVLHAIKETGAEKVILVGHSAGGVVGRGYLCDGAPAGNTAYAGHERVTDLVMLGSPIRAVPAAQQPGMKAAAWIDENFPGAYFAPKVNYLSIAGRLVRGNANGTLNERRAFTNYQFVSTVGEQWGDGVVPTALTKLDGVAHVEIDDIGHSPTWQPWFGSNEKVVRKWWNVVEASDAPMLQASDVFV